MGMACLRFTCDNSELKKIFSAGFSEFIERKKNTPKQIAEILGVTESAVNGWKYGRSFPDVPNFLKLIELGLSPFDVMGEELRLIAMINFYDGQIESTMKTFKAVKKVGRYQNVENRLMNQIRGFNEKKTELEQRLSELMNVPMNDK